MPRTKRAAPVKPAELKSSKSEVKMRDLVLKQFVQEKEKIMDELDKACEKELQELCIYFKSLRMKLSANMMNRTIAEIRNGEINDSELSSTMALTDLTNTFNSTRSATNTTKKNNTSRNITQSTISSTDSEFNRTKTISTSKKPRSRRSQSAGCDDEGYTTAESTRGTTSGGAHHNTRQSRSKTKLDNSKAPVSRSLSRTVTVKKTNPYRTPVNKQPRSASSGTITPKCKPNTPLLYVRRPKVGEVAWSNQGSPLLVSSTVAPEQTPNVNIPIGDDILSMLPTRGAVRESQIPEIDDTTRSQLEILRDNLIKMCNSIRK